MMDLYQRLLDYFSLGQVADQSLAALSHYLRRREDPLPMEEREALSRAIDQLGQAREGFHLTLRTSATTSLEDLRYVVHRLLWAEGLSEELGLPAQPSEEIPVPRLQLVLFGHALTSIIILPRLPASRVTYPQEPPSYADISVPTTPGQLLDRLEEAEGVAWKVMAGPATEIAEDPLRRTYGFFEASSWLVSTHLRLFLKRPGDAHA